MSTETATAESTPSFVEKVIEDVEQVFVFQDLPEKNTIGHLKEILETRPIHERELLRAGLAFICDRLPEKVKGQLHEKVFTNAPIDIPEDEHGFKVLEKVGAGFVHSVYFLSTENLGSWAVGIKRVGFESTEKALEFAVDLEKDYKEFKEIYGKDPILIPKEARVVYENHKGQPNVMFFREFVNGPIKDIFSYEPEELQALLQRNYQLQEQLKSFVNASFENQDSPIVQKIDLLGKNNLAIVGEEGEEKLILIEPHTCDTLIDNEIKKRINERMHYLAQMLPEYA